MELNDFIAGYAGAAGIQAALIRRAKEGGSYHVRVNLARCAMWFNSLGTFDTDVPGTGEQHQNPGPGHHHRPNPLRRTVPTGPTGAVLRNEALLAGPGTGGAWVKQAGMDNHLRLRATVTDHQES